MRVHHFIEIKAGLVCFCFVMRIHVFFKSNNKWLVHAALGSEEKEDRKGKKVKKKEGGRGKCSNDVFDLFSDHQT